MRTVPFLNTGVIRTLFQQLGSIEHSKGLLNRMDRGIHNSCTDSLRQNNGQSSGPGALEGFSRVSLSNTMAGVIVILVSVEWQLSD